MDKYYKMFRTNFPFIVRNTEEAMKIIKNPENKIIDVFDEHQNLIGTSIIHKNTILMLCVDKKHRHQGLGSKLLNDSEDYIFNQGFDSVQVGVGDNYLMPGIPMATKPYDEVLKEDNVYKEVNNKAFEFFTKRGYSHSWPDANCFDMRADLENVDFPKESIGDTIDGITYRFASSSDIPAIVKCTDEAWKEFSPFYQEETLYNNPQQKVLIAIKDKEVCGTLIISMEHEAPGLGSVGCTSVLPKYRGQHIGVNLVVLGTKYLKEIGLKKGFLGYTYSGLDKMYGYAGYKICVYYDMAVKKRILK